MTRCRFVRVSSPSVNLSSKLLSKYTGGIKTYLSFRRRCIIPTSSGCGTMSLKLPSFRVNFSVKLPFITSSSVLRIVRF